MTEDRSMEQWARDLIREAGFDQEHVDEATGSELVGISNLLQELVEKRAEVTRLKSVIFVTEGGRSYRAETMEFARAMLDDKEAFGLAMVTILRDELRSGKNILVISPMNGKCICGTLLWFQSERDSGYCQKCAPKLHAQSSGSGGK